MEIILVCLEIATQGERWKTINTSASITTKSINTSAETIYLF